MTAAPASPDPGGSAGNIVLYKVAAVSSSSAWAVGSHSANTATLTLIEHWNGRAWNQVASPNQ